jgi:hypothetical protein
MSILYFVPRKPPPGWIDARGLFAGTPKSTLAQWRDSGLLPEPIRISLGRGKGSASYYPPGTDALLARLKGACRKIRERDSLFWELWLDAADYPVDIRRWVLKRLDRFSAVFRDPRAPEILGALKDPKAAAAIISTLPRRHPARVMLGTLEDRTVATLCSWALNIAIDRDPSISLYDPQSEVLAGLLKAAGLPRTLPPPDKEINPEMISLAYFRELIAEASEKEILQVRSDCRAIAVLAATIGAIDWNAVSRALDHVAAFVHMTSPEPASYRARRTERHARRRNQLQPALIRRFLALWKSLDIRAFLILALVYIRRSPEHGKIFSETIALSHWALTQFPHSTLQSKA